VRGFNRFYTRLVGALDEGHLRSPFSLAEVRVLYEVAHSDGVTATALARDLRLDAGYLSRMLRALEQRGLIRRSRSPEDARRSVLALTARGLRTFTDMNERAHEDVATLLGPLHPEAKERLVAAMRTIESILGGSADDGPEYILRPHRLGDMAWVVHRQAILYAREYGWNGQYEALTARVVADFIEQFDHRRDRCWIAERNGGIVGSVFVVKHPERPGVAKLRMLYVEPSARGLGIGRRLVNECTRFARETGYQTLTLWTNSVLASARKIYEAEGYRLVSEERHRLFGDDAIGQTWELELRPASGAKPEVSRRRTSRSAS
jgi:DNA-binding MarR family transcriptional regulator/GNAT superfamily N-acetyltransferase